MEEIVNSLKHIKNMKTVMVHLRKGISNAVGKGGGIKSGVWSSLRAVSFRNTASRETLIIERKVCVSYPRNQESAPGCYWGGEPTNPTEGKGGLIFQCLLILD